LRGYVGCLRPASHPVGSLGRGWRPRTGNAMAAPPALRCATVGGSRRRHSSTPSSGSTSSPSWRRPARRAATAAACPASWSASCEPTLEVPPPRVRGLRHHGLFAPHAKVRDRVVPPPEPVAPAAAARKRPGGEAGAPHTRERGSPHLPNPLGRLAREGLRDRRPRLPRVRRPDDAHRLHRRADHREADSRRVPARMPSSCGQLSAVVRRRPICSSPTIYGMGACSMVSLTRSEG
jgi:hypothetical protein